MFDEAALVAGITSSTAHAVLPTRERTLQVQPLHRQAPGQGRQVKEQGGAPAQNQQATEQHQQDEGQVQEDQGVGGEAKEHGGGSQLSVPSA
ncbi:hypothetical protein D3C78_1798120 [compost metagenome]